MAGSYTGFLTLQGAPLYYEVMGAGYPVLFIHAGIADSRMWDEQVTTFSQHYRTIRYDLRGYGQSQFPAGPFAHYEDAAALLAALEVEQAHIIGISFGGQIALNLALAHPSLVSSLVLVAPSIGGRPPSPEVQHFIAEEETLLVQNDLDGATGLNLRMWVDGPHRSPTEVDPTVRARVAAMQRHAFSIPETPGAEEIDLQPPAITRLHEIQVPTLIVVGDYDLADKVVAAEQLSTQLPQAQLKVISKVAHMVTMEQPTQFNEIALHFLNTAGGTMK